ncbi:MAG: restriction endonuclease subunit S, partial [Staphylococcus equorum]|nr:restriction endonuclease subunit S [Staphylococcus equorum]
MTNELANVPELRFTGFEDKWEETNLGNIANIVGGGTPKTEIPEYWNGEINWYSPVEIGDRNYVYESKNKITQLGLKKSSAKILPIGTVLFTARAGIGNTAILKKEGATNQGFQSIIPKEGVLDTYFIFSRTNELKRYGEIHGAGSTFVEISGKEMAKMPISIPVIKEQQKIGDFFSKLDQQIELEEQKLEKLEEQKKGYMQKLFSQELRFKDQDGNDYPKWEKKFIKDIFIFENNRRKPITSSLREKGLYPYYGATGIIDYVKDYLFNNEERLLIGEDGAKWGQFEKSSFIANGQYWVNNH